MLEVWSQGVGRGMLSLTSLMHACIVAQSHPALCIPIDCNLPCSSVWDSPSKNIAVGVGGWREGRGWNLPLQPSGKVSELLLWWAQVWFLVGELFLMARGVVKKKKKTKPGDFPGGAVVKNLGFHGRGYRFDSWLGNQVTAMLCNVTPK